MTNENNENVGKILANFMQKTNLISRFQIFTKRTHTILFGISIFTACYTTFSFFMHQNMGKLEETMRTLKYLILYNAGGIKETASDILSKIETIIDHIEEQNEKLDHYKKEVQVLIQTKMVIQSEPVQNTSIDVSTQTEPNEMHPHDEIDNECYDIIPCSNIKKYHFI